ARSTRWPLTWSSASDSWDRPTPRGPRHSPSTGHRALECRSPWLAAFGSSATMVDSSGGTQWVMDAGERDAHDSTRNERSLRWWMHDRAAAHAAYNLPRRHNEPGCGGAACGTARRRDLRDDRRPGPAKRRAVCNSLTAAADG